MSAQDNIRIIKEYVSTHDDQYVSEDVIYHDYSVPEPIHGREATKELLDTLYRTGFSDAKLEIRHMTADENSVVLEVTFHGVNTGPLRGHSPSGMRLELPVCGVFDVEGGVIRRVRIYYDSNLLERELGWKSQ